MQIDFQKKKRKKSLKTLLLFHTRDEFVIIDDVWRAHQNNRNRFCSMCSLLLWLLLLLKISRKKKTETVCMFVNPYNCLVHRDRTDAGYYYYYCMAIVIVFSFYLGPVSSRLNVTITYCVDCRTTIIFYYFFENFNRTATIRCRRKRIQKWREIKRRKKWTRILLHMQTADIDIHNIKKLTLFGNDHAWKWKLLKNEF